jgi:2'-5' RNA ligase
MRVFAGLPLPADVVTGLQKTIDYIRQARSRMSFVKPAGMHITMHFFGEIGENDVNNLVRLMDDQVLCVKKIRAKTGALDRFPKRGNPRVIFVSFVEGIGEIAGYYKTYNELIAGLGYEEEKREEFVPHITLARNKGERIDDGFLAHVPVDEREFFFDRLVLYKSVLTSKGAEYSPLTTVMLA